MHKYKRTEVNDRDSSGHAFRKTLLSIICLASLSGLVSPSGVCLAAKEGDLVDVAPFGELKKWDSQGKDYGVVWEDSRDIFRVVFRFADSKTIPDPAVFMAP